MKKQPLQKFIFITGGVASSLGKGVASASLGALLKARGYKVQLRKLDPYLNVDPGTMNPIQHGEVFVTDDGAETDLDLGHYERFIDQNNHKTDSVSSGRIYSTLLEKERRGDYLGGTVQIIPHITNLIKDFILNDTKDFDFTICEIGGTVGDIEGQPFLEAIRQLGFELGRDKTLFMHLTLLPYLECTQELKTKPTQHSVKALLSIGIQPHLILCRSERPIPDSAINKISLFCNVAKENIIPALNAKSIYEVPVLYHGHKFDNQILKHFNLPCKKIDLKKWENIASAISNPKGEITIGIVGKYIQLQDAYKSLNEALFHAGLDLKHKVKIEWVDSRKIKTRKDLAPLKNVDGILIPGGFGKDGIEGKILAAEYARKNNVPYFGICLGMQVAVIEFARNVLKIKDANSSEFIKTKNSVIGLMNEWTKDGNLGGTMRLGAYEAKLKPNSLAHKIYKKTKISERHRHRYEVNINFKDKLEKAGLIFSGMSPNNKLPEVVEIPKHKFFIGTQFHPEFKSRPFNPSPIFKEFVRAAIANK